jgi:hypothetical protein
MSDPTPEEEEHPYAMMVDRCQGYDHETHGADFCDECFNYIWSLEQKIVVAAERERCAEVDSTVIACPTCKCVPGEFCLATQGGVILLCHHERWRAAIRKGADE